MKRNYPIMIILLFMLALSFAAHESYAAEVEIGAINLDRTSNTSFWAIEGSVRNLESHDIRGYVNIKFLDREGRIVKAVATAVNDGQPIAPGGSGAFIYKTFSTHFSGIAGFKAVFVEVEIEEPEEALSSVLR
jgi:hypothetical protein